jgi:hypothetical protein
MDVSGGGDDGAVHGGGLGEGQMKAMLRWIVVGLTGVVAVWILVTAPYQAAVNGVDNLWLLSWLGLLVVGGFLVARRPENRLSWTLAAIGLLAPIAAISEVLAGAVGGAPALLVALFSNLAIGGFVLIPLVLLWYPTGRVPSLRWAWLEKALVALGALLAVYYVIRPGRLGITEIENPIGIGFLAPLRDSGVENAAGFLIAFLGVLAFASLVARWRRAQGPERSQLKLVALAVSVTAGWLVLTLTLGLLIDVEGPVGDAMFLLFFVLGLNALAVSIAIAIVRHRLYEIDRVISRTVGYVLVIGLLGVVYFAAITALTSVLSADSELAVAGSTLAVAALFNPVRRRVLRAVDRRFNRPRYDQEKVIDEFSRSLRNQVDRDEVVGAWVSVVSETMQPSTLAIWVRSE